MNSHGAHEDMHNMGGVTATCACTPPPPPLLATLLSLAHTLISAKEENDGKEAKISGTLTHASMRVYAYTWGLGDSVNRST